jgi:hypothetical protein
MEHARLRLSFLCAKVHKTELDKCEIQCHTMFFEQHKLGQQLETERKESFARITALNKQIDTLLAETIRKADAVLHMTQARDHWMYKFRLLECRSVMKENIVSTEGRMGQDVLNLIEQYVDLEEHLSDPKHNTL